jgi:hypothetical protein
VLATPAIVPAPFAHRSNDCAPPSARMPIRLMATSESRIAASTEAG